MKIIAAEEHFVMPPKPGAPAPKGLPPLEQGTMLGAPWLTNPACGSGWRDNAGTFHSIRPGLAS